MLNKNNYPLKIREIIYKIYNKINNIPCFLSSSCFLPININKSNNIVTTNNTARSKLINVGIFIWKITAVNPKIQRILNI